MPVADVNGQQLSYTDSGGDGPAVLFSHGFLMDKEMFGPQIEALSGDYRVIAWDERGFGDTVTSDEPWTFWDSARDALGLLDTLGVERGVLAGMSQGGFLSLRAALLAPERVSGLVLIDSQAGTEDPAKIPGYDQLMSTWEEHGLIDEVADTIAAIILGAGWEGSPQWIAKWRARDVALVRRAYDMLMAREDDVQPRLGELTMPVLIVHGDGDLAIELPVAEKLAADLPDAELVVIAGAGHASNLTHPDDVNPALREFLARVSAPVS